MITQSLISLSSLQPIYQLARRCEITDGYPVKLYWNLLESRKNDPQAFDYLYFPPHQFRPKPVALLSIYYFQDGVEITAMVDPDHRRQGVFSRLLNNALQILRLYKVPSYMLTCHAKAELFNNECASRGARLDHVEIEMKGPKHIACSPTQKIKLQQVQASELDLLTEIHAASFPGPTLASIRARLASMLAEPNRQTWVAMDLATDKPVGKLHVREDEKAIFLHDLGIMPAFQRQGYGASLVYTWYQQYEFPPNKSVIVDVLGDNEAAIKLYTACGFTITNQYNFWRFQLKA